jgi:hypothetical protein
MVSARNHGLTFFSFFIWMSLTTIACRGSSMSSSSKISKRKLNLDGLPPDWMEFGISNRDHHILFAQSFRHDVFDGESRAEKKVELMTRTESMIPSQNNQRRSSRILGYHRLNDIFDKPTAGTTMAEDILTLRESWTDDELDEQKAISFRHKNDPRQYDVFALSDLSPSAGSPILRGDPASMASPIASSPSMSSPILSSTPTPVPSVNADNNSPVENNTQSYTSPNEGSTNPNQRGPSSISPNKSNAPAFSSPNMSPPSNNYPNEESQNPNSPSNLSPTENKLPNKSNSPALNSPNEGNSPAVNSPNQSDSPALTSPNEGNSPAVNSPNESDSPALNSPNESNSPAVNSPNQSDSPALTSPNESNSPAVNSPNESDSPALNSPNESNSPALTSPNEGNTPALNSPNEGNSPGTTSNPISSPGSPFSSTPFNNIDAYGNCTVDDEGFFGLTAGNASDLNFSYEIEYNAGGNLSTILTELERALGDIVLPAVNSDLCTGTGVGNDNVTTNRLYQSEGDTATEWIPNNDFTSRSPKIKRKFFRQRENKSSSSRGVSRLLFPRRRLYIVGLSPLPGERVNFDGKSVNYILYLFSTPHQKLVVGTHICLP